MKNLYPTQLFLKSMLIGVLGSSISVSAQTVPNGAFEDWINKQSIYDPTVTYEDLNLWTTANYTYSAATNVTKSTDSYSGYSALLTPIAVGNQFIDNMLKQTFPISTKPLYINGYYKTSLVSGDYGQVGLTINDANNKFLATTGMTFKDNVSTFTPFSIKISNFYTAAPGNAQILINLITKNAASSFWVDEITLSTIPIVTGVKDNSVAENSATFYPSPVIDKLFVKNLPAQASTFRLANSSGQEVYSGDVSTLVDGFSSKEYQKGIYFAEILDAQQKSILRKKVIVN